MSDVRTTPAPDWADPASPYFVVREEFAALNALIPRLLTSDVDLVAEISRYIVHSGGKRMRPLLVLLTGRCCGIAGQEALIKLAAVIELLHTATLLHDDVVDQSMLRRGRATANANWGNAPSVLVGDFLYSRAFQLMADLNDMRIIHQLADATNVIAQGEVDQLSQIGNTNLTEAQYTSVITAKTATLFRAAAETAATLAKTNQSDAFAKFGLHFGLSFQLIDDALDYEGDSAQLGKNVGDDLAEGKLTLPLIYTLSHGASEDAELVRAAVEARNRTHLEAVVAAVRRSGALTYTRDQAAAHAKQAAVALSAVTDSDAKKVLLRLAAATLTRSS